MIKVVNETNIDKGIILKHSNNVFVEALAFYRDNEQRRNVCIDVCGVDGQQMYSLVYEKNQVSELDYVGDFWEYDKNDINLDLELVLRGEVFIFFELEEYTFVSAQIIQERFPDKYIFFLDKRASMFFRETEHFIIIDSLSTFFQDYRDFLSKVIFLIDSKKEFIPNYVRCIVKRYHSLEFFNGMFWRCDITSYGEENPEICFYLINNTIDSAGMADLIKFTLYRVMMARFKGLEPIIDLSVEGDDNQFNGGDGRNAWEMFFEQISDYTVDDVYRSKNVIKSVDQLDFFNPYVYEYANLADEKMMLAKYLKFNSKTKEYIEKIYQEKMPINGSVLGVIGRGTDYRCEKARWVPSPANPTHLVHEVELMLKRKNYEYVFLATEDAQVYKVFQESSFINKIICVEQERIFYGEENKSMFLSEIYKQKNYDGYKFNLRYLAILYILSQCDSLISGCYCGAVRISEALNGGRYDEVIILK